MIPRNILVALLLLSAPAFAEKCRVVDTTTNAKVDWDSCQNAQSSAQWMADTQFGEGLAVEHRNWFGKKWMVKIIPHEITKKPETEPGPVPEIVDPRPEMWRI